jgi:serine/threonine protein kinase
MKVAAPYPSQKSRPASRDLDRYTLIEKLGEGGMGVVWRARDKKTGSDVAIKVMKNNSDAESHELFIREWKTLSDLSHPNIVDVRDTDVFHEDNEQKPFFVMPLLRGFTLANLIRRSSERLTCGRVVEIFVQVCRGLQAAHQRGLIHRDLKPSNIFVMDDDTVKIIDFGVVHLAGAHSVAGQKGTYEYMSPEQIQLGELTPATDIFSVGVSLYEALTGRKPFTGRSLDETLHAVLKLIPPPVSEINPAIPHTISQVVHKCVAKQPINRFSSAKELGENLAKAYRNETIFDVNRISDRLERIRSAVKSDDLAFASELLLELQSEGHIHPEIARLGMQIESIQKQKRIEHLLSGARTRIEQGEIPLGLEKLRELLELAPENSEALALKTLAENQRSEAQAGKWMELAHTHLGNCDFAAARHAAEEALNSRPTDTRAIQLLRRIESVEVEAKRVREQKEQLYLSALRHYQEGEIESAFSRLGRLFSVVRSRPEGSMPERDAIYESFYKEVCSEHDLIHARIEEAQRHLQDENFSQALAICSERLAKYPNNATFQTLKIQIEDAERQKISADLASASKSADAEPDLDRRANIWREACDRHPNDPQFAQQLSVTSERRDLVNSIVAKAHQFGEKGMYNEELAQWEMLRNIHPRYPGLIFELEQCKRRRDLQARNEEKAQMVEEIVRLMEAQEFSRALEKAAAALQEFPKDSELAGLEKLSQEGLERSLECTRLFAAAQAEAASNHRYTAVELLNQALMLEPRNSSVQEVLINLLIEQARSELDQDLSAAEALYRQARALNPAHRTVRSFDLEISTATRQRFVGEYLTEARGLVAVGKPETAWERVHEALATYPQEARLQQYRDFLIKNHPELELRAKQAEAQKRPADEGLSEEGRLKGELEQPSEASVITSAEMGQEELGSLLRGPTSTLNPGSSQPAAERLDHGSETVLFNCSSPSQPEPLVDRIQRLADVQRRRVQSMYQSLRSNSLFVRGAAGAVLTLTAAGAGIALYLHQHGRTSTTGIHANLVHVTTNPRDSVLTTAGVAQHGHDFIVDENRDKVIEVSHPGYLSRLIHLRASDKVVNVALDALPVKVSVITADEHGEVSLDGSAAGTLVNGAIDGLEVAADGKEHTIEIIESGGRLTSVGFQANPGQAPTVLLPAKGKTRRDMFIIAGMGQTATIYGGEDLKSAKLGGSPFAFTRSGANVNLANGTPTAISYAVGNRSGTLTLEGSDSPSLTVRSIELTSELWITANVVAATLTANGKPVSRSGRGWRITSPGTYDLVLSAENFKPQSWTATLKAGQSIRDARRLDLIPGPVAVLSGLTISGGTPGAVVDVDGNPTAVLEADGSAHLTANLSAGHHQIRIHKEGFCSTRELGVDAAPPADVHVEAGTLDPCARLTLQPGSIPATVRAARIGDPNARWVELSPRKATSLPAGNYRLAVESEHNGSYGTEIRLEAGSNADFTPQFAPLQECKLEHAANGSFDGNGAKPHNGAAFTYLSAGCLNVNLTITRPKPGFTGKRKVDWVIETSESAGRIAWEMDGERISRKGVIGDQAFDRRSAILPPGMHGDGNPYVIRIRVEGSRVVISDGEGAVLDDYTPQNSILQHLSGARLGVKSSAGFTFAGGGM